MAVWWWLGGTTGQRCLTPHVQIPQQKRVTYHFVLLLFYNILGDSGGDGGGHLSGTLERALACGKLGVKISD